MIERQILLEWVRWRWSPCSCSCLSSSSWWCFREKLLAVKLLTIQKVNVLAAKSHFNRYIVSSLIALINLSLKPTSPDHWKSWGRWSSCTQFCGGGTRTRTRECKSSSRECKGKGSPLETSTCANDPCPGQPSQLDACAILYTSEWTFWFDHTRL